MEVLPGACLLDMFVKSISVQSVLCRRKSTSPRLDGRRKLLDANDAPVINPVTGVAEQYSRTMNYVQIPIFAHLGWGSEDKGFQFFFQAGPQLGFCLSESTKMNFNFGGHKP